MRLIRTVLDPDLLAAYNLGVTKAVAAHAADMAVAAGVCAICKRRKVAGHSRSCAKCRVTGLREPTNSRPHTDSSASAAVPGGSRTCSPSGALPGRGARSHLSPASDFRPGDVWEASPGRA